MTDAIKRRGLHEDVAVVLRQEILQSKPGQCLDSITALAKRFSVSVTTLRDALLLLARAGLVELRHGSGTYVADRSLQQHVAVLIDYDISHPRTSYFYLRVTQQLPIFFEKQGFRSILYVGQRPFGEQTTHPTCPEFLEAVNNQMLLGVALVSTLPHPQWFDPLVAQNIPVVGAAERSPGVRIDFLPFIRKGVQYLLEHQRDRIAVLGASPTPNSSKHWLNTFKQEMNTHGKPIQDCWIRHKLNPFSPGWSGDEFRAAWLSKEEKPNGLLITDDSFFTDVALAIMKLDIRVPEQLMIVTLANRGSDIYYPFPVVRFEYDPDVFAETLGSMLIKLIKGEPLREKRIYLSFQRTIIPDEVSNATLSLSHAGNF